MTIFTSFALAIAGGMAYASAQSSYVAQTFPPVADSSIFAPLTLPPAPSAIRSANGAPGPKYWQNRADYDLHATLDTATGTVQGSMILRYTASYTFPKPIARIELDPDHHLVDTNRANNIWKAH